MTFDESLALLDGYILANKAHARFGGELVTVAVVDGSAWVWTDEGRALLASLEQPKAVVVEASMLAGAEQFTTKTVRRTRAKLLESAEPDPAE